jgi:hypothetical protein
VDYPSTSNIRVFKKLWITHLLNMLIEIVDHPSHVEVLIYIFLWPCPFLIKEIVPSMEEVFVTLRHMQQ